MFLLLISTAAVKNEVVSIQAPCKAFLPVLHEGQPSLVNQICFRVVSIISILIFFFTPAAEQNTIALVIS